MASRRRCEELIAAGRVAVDGVPVTQQGRKINPAVQRVTVDGRPVALEPRVYWIVHKPRGVVTSCRDPQGRRTVLDLVPGGLPRLYPVGRLDFESEGLVLLTNDGELAGRLMHPRHGCPKLYRVWTTRELTPAECARLTEGVELEGHRCRMDTVRRVGGSSEGAAVYEVTLREGRNRQIRRMLAALGVGVRRLVRIGLGPLRLGRLAPGRARPLTAREVRLLRRRGAYPAAGSATEGAANGAGD